MLRSSLVLGLALTLFAGCKSTGTDRAAGAVSSAETLKKGYNDLSAQVDKTIAALNALGKAEGELTPAFASYVTELGALNSQQEAVVKQSEDVRDRIKDYIEGWAKQMEGVENPAIREHAEARRASAEKNFAEARDKLVTIRDQYTKFLKDLNDIKILLEFFQLGVLVVLFLP